MLALLTALVAVPAGCGGEPLESSSRPKVRPESPAATLLRSRTDQVLRDLAAGHFRELAQYYAPDSEVDLRREIEHHLGGSLGSMQLYSWTPSAIGVEFSPDGLHARTGVEVLLQSRANELYRKGVLFSWSRSDAREMTFYLLPHAAAER
jgi:hypothetical protein